jgi:hypothetical protein
MRWASSPSKERAMTRLVFPSLVVLLLPVGVSCTAADDPPEEKSAAALSPPAGKEAANADRAIVDEYLTKWDQFAQGQNELVPYLRDQRPTFEAALTRLLRSGDRGAPARLVFYAVVQVGGFIPADSELGAAARTLLGADFPLTTTKTGQKVLFCSDLYFWWEKHQSRFERFPLFEEWLSRDFAKTTVLPAYRRLREQSR